MSDDFVFAWRRHQRELQQDRRLWWAFARGCVVTAIAMLSLFVYALFGI
jgi:hypothetical protein